MLGSGVLNIYPPENRELAFDIRKRGALVSEAPPHGEPLSGAFPQRNRIISGMSLVSPTAGCKAQLSLLRSQIAARACFACSA